MDFVVEKAQLDKVDLDSILSDTASVDCIDLHQSIVSRMSGANAELRQSLQLLSGFTDYHVEPDHRTTPFKIMLTWPGRRTLIPSEVLPAQIDVLAEFLPSVKNAGLRARMADVVWLVQRWRSESAETAISAYCDCLEQVRAGTATFMFGNQSPWSNSAMELLIRAARISHATKWKLKSSIRLQELIWELVLTAYKNQKPENFLRIAKVYIDQEFSPKPKPIASWCEHLVRSEALLTEPDQRIELWKVAARSYDLTKADHKSTRCMIEVAECHVQKADLVESAITTTQFLRNAIKVLRSCRDTKERREELEGRLRQIQPSIQDEMGTVSREVNHRKLMEHHIASIEGISWPQAFRYLIHCAHPPEPDQVCFEIQKQMDTAEHKAMNPKEIVDFQGRLIFRSPGFTEDEEECKLHLRFLMSLHREKCREKSVFGAINPIRRVICDEHLVSVNAVQEMIKDSPFIPPEHVYIFARAIVHFLAGESIEAASLLVPQLENSLRHTLDLVGVDTSTTDDNGIQTEASLSRLLNPKNKWRRQLDENLPQRYVHEIDLLFNFAGGPSIRNQIAHGKVSESAFWDHNMVYASWLIIHLAVHPLIDGWGDTKETKKKAINLAEPKTEDS